MYSPRLRKGGKKKGLRLGYACFILFFVSLALAAMVGNVMMARHHSQRRKERLESTMESHGVSRVVNSKPRAVGKMPVEAVIENPQPNQLRHIEESSRQKQAEKEASEADVEMEAVRRKQLEQEANKAKEKLAGDQTTAQEDDNADANKIHVVFSTSCHVKQDWQSYVFFWSAMAQDQKGTVTRVVSGCTPEQEVEMKNVFKEQIAIMSDRFRLHFTPEFGRVPGISYQSTKYWNKPFGLKHWLENAFGYNYDEGIMSTALDDDIVVLVDPDMLMQRPFVNHFPLNMEDLWIAPIRKGPTYDKVTHGKPMAQDYSFGAAWLISSKANLTHVVGPDSPVHGVSDRDARVLYSAGPPYIATAKDMYQIAYHWAKFLPRIFDLFPKFMAEMYGYCMAAAHLQLKHQLAQGFMVSNIFFKNAEGWSFLNGVTDNACDVAQFKDNVPQVIHFCQRYSIGEYFLSKYKLPVDILSCDFPLLELPPLDIAAHTDYSHYGDGSITKWHGDQKMFGYRNAYMVCSLMPALNKAATFFKDHHCPNGANYDQTWNTFTAEEIEAPK